MATVDNNIEVTQTPIEYWTENGFYANRFKRVNSIEELTQTLKEKNVSGIKVTGNTVEVMFDN